MMQLGLRRSQRVQLLREVELFKGCSTSELGRISSLTTEHRVAEGEVLTRRGDAGLEAFVVVEGRATASRKGKTIARLGPGALFGELALLDGGRRTATVTAETDMLLLVLSRREFASMLATAPSVARKIICELGARLRRTDELLDSRSTTRRTPLTV
jgi:CRP/FNR family transcriptional regulator, cyclic AMP receptor protein